MTPRILVLGKNYSTALGVIRSLGKKNYHVEVLYITNEEGASKKVASSKYVKECTEFIGRMDDAIVDLILEKYAAKSQKYILFPTDDYTSSLIDRNRDKLNPFFFMPYIKDGKQGSITTLMDKAVQSKLAEEHGLLTAKSWIITLDSKEEVRIPEEIIYPCFVKPLVSAKGYKREIGICENREELNKKLIGLKNQMSDRSIMVQEYLKIDQEYSISGLCVDQDVIMPALIKKLIVGKRERGVAIIGQLIEMNYLNDTVDKLVQYMRSIHYYGMFDIDLMEVDDKIYFGELNLRSSGTGYALQLAGVNLPDMFVQAVAGNREWKNQNCKVNFGLKFFYDKTAWEDYQSYHITRNQLKLYRKEADYSLLVDEDDKKPANIFIKEMKIKILKSRIKKCIHTIVKRKDSK